ncbi:GNAT family N-acetyltransferase [Bradyrhizobium sp. HKCCYLS1011]|uniref:GNAT family N-acetyltransferase n=1 Tax=Bradyrhizobium sp. HKCCYLS1011 TaxID=3420733 RepID=UPI003EBF0D29
MALTVTWQDFAALSAAEIYRVLMLRQQVFVVEQLCAYLDADGLDEAAIHGLGWDQDGGLVAVARILPPGSRFDMPSIGRIAVARHARGLGYGRTLVGLALAETERRYPDRPVRIDAQAHLEQFYASFGFVRSGHPFDEDGIPHVAMISQSSSA